MDSLIESVRVFSRGVIEQEHLPLPVRLQALDLGSNVIFEMEASKDEHGEIRFSNFESPGAGGAAPGPYAVRFIPNGSKSFLRNLP